jgi:hypothetical protein
MADLITTTGSSYGHVTDPVTADITTDDGKQKITSKRWVTIKTHIFFFSAVFFL